MHISVQGRVRCGIVVAVMLVLTTACGRDAESPRQAVVRARATEFLEVLRAGRWSQAADFVTVDAVTQVRMEIPEDANSEIARTHIARWFEQLYGNVPPGAVHSVEFASEDSTLAVVTYIAGDFDTFRMRLVNGEWYYTLDSNPD